VLGERMDENCRMRAPVWVKIEVDVLTRRTTAEIFFGGRTLRQRVGNRGSNERRDFMAQTGNESA
jgi:hypothetical protein